MPQQISIGESQKIIQGAIGVQRRIVIAKVPATAEGSLVGKTLLEAGALTVNGIYRCLLPIAGLAAVLEVFLTATITGGTVTSDLDTLYFVGNSVDDSTWVKKSAGTGDGPLATGIMLTPTISTLRGEEYAVLDLTLAGVTSVAFTVAEFNGR